MTVVFFWKALLLGKLEEHRESFFLHLLTLKCFHLKIIRMPQWHIRDPFLGHTQILQNLLLGNDEEGSVKGKKKGK